MTKRILLGLLVLSVSINVLLAQALLKERNSSTVSDVDKNGALEDSLFQNGNQYPLIRVVDGDTITVGFGERIEYVRLIGIDAPESNDPGIHECYASESTAYLRKLLDVGTVTLFFDASQGVRDKYNRLLSYVELADGNDVGEQMLRNGYAREYTYANKYERSDAYKEAEASAVSSTLGLWGLSGCN